MWNPWKHLRLAGAVLIAASIFIDETSTRLWLVVIGMFVQYIGVLGAVDLLERKFDALIEEKTNADSTDNK